MNLGLVILFLLGAYLAISGLLKLRAMRQAAAGRITIPLLACNSVLQEVVRIGRFRWVEYVPNITYRYEMGGVEIVGDRIYLAGTISHSSRAKMLAFVKQLAPAQAYIKNNNPNDAVLVLEPSAQWKAAVRGAVASGMLLMVVATSLFFLLR